MVPSGVLHELLLDSPFERWVQFFKQNKAPPVQQDVGNPFLKPGIRIEDGGCRMPGATHSMGDDMSAPTVSDQSFPSLKPKRNGYDDDDWVLYAYHPKFDPFEVHEAVAIVADRFLVSGLSRFGFQSITLQPEARYMVRQLAARPWRRDEPMRFPVLGALCPATGNIGREIFAQAASNPATDPSIVPSTDPNRASSTNAYLR